MAYRRDYPRIDHAHFAQYKVGMVATKEEREAQIVNDYSNEFVRASNPLLYPAGRYNGYFDRGISNSGFSSPEANNKLFAKVAEALRPDEAMLGATMLEWRSSYEMIAKRALQLAHLYKNWRRTVSGPPITVRKKRRRGRQRESPVIDNFLTKRQAAGWLEYWMGWAPLVGDIHAAVKQLDLPVPPNHLRVSWSKTREYNEGHWANGSVSHWYSHSSKYSCRSRYGCTAQVQVVNANLYLARNMGLTNPLEWAWEVTPWSWLVNWFVNVDQVLQQHSVYHGLAVSRIAGTLKSDLSGVCRNTYWSWNGSAWVPLTDNQQFSGTAFFRRELVGLPTPELVLDIPLRLSLTRAATAISLLRGRLSS